MLSFSFHHHYHFQKKKKSKKYLEFDTIVHIKHFSCDGLKSAPISNNENLYKENNKNLNLPCTTTKYLLNFPKYVECFKEPKNIEKS